MNNSSTELYISINSYILILLPIFMVTGPAIPDITISLTGIFFIIYTFFNKDFSYYRLKYFYLFAIFSTYIILRAIFSEYPITSITDEGSIFYFRYIFFFLAVSFLFEKYTHLSIYFYYLGNLLIGIILIDTIRQFTTGFNFFGLEPYSSNRMTSFMADEILGRFVTYLCISLLIIKSYIYEKLKFNFISSLLLMISSLVIIVLSGERIPLLVFLSFIFLFNLYFYRKNLGLFAIFISIIVLIFSLLLNIDKLKSRIIDNSLDEINETSLKFLPFSKHYEEHFHSAYKMGMGNKLFGQGPSLFEKLCNNEEFIVSERSCSSHPHSYYFQLFSELGSIGLLFMVTFYIYLIFKICCLMKKYNNETVLKNYIDPIIGCLLFLIIYLSPFIPNMSFYNNWNNILPFFIFGFYIFLKRNLEKNELYIDSQ